MKKHQKLTLCKLLYSLDVIVFICKTRVLEENLKVFFSLRIPWSRLVKMDSRTRCGFCLLIFFPVSLRFNWHITLYYFKVYNIMLWYMCMLQCFVLKNGGLGGVLNIGNRMEASVQFNSVSQLCPTLCDPMNWSTPGLPVHHHLLEFTQTHVHQVDDAIPFSSCSQSLPASGSFPMSQLFAWDGQSIGVSASASVLPMNTQDWSLIGWTGWISLQSKGLSRVFSNTTVQKHQFFSAQLSSQSNLHIHTWPLEKP